MKNDKLTILKAVVSLLAIVIVFGAAAFGLSFYTNPLIEENKKGAENDKLVAVLPEGKKFDVIYDSANAAQSELKDVDKNVLKIYKSEGAGFVIQCQTIKHEQSSAPTILTFGVTTDGKITKVDVNEYHDSWDVQEKAPNFIPSFVGQDSALSGVDIHTGATLSATAIRNAVATGMKSLADNGMIKEGQKTPAQILEEVIPSVFPGMTLNGVVKAEKINASGNIQAALKAKNDSGFAYLFTKDEKNFYAIVNASGECKVYDEEINDVTAEQADMVTEAKTASSSQKNYFETVKSKILKKYPDAEVEQISFNTFNSVVSAAKFTVEEKTYYFFLSRNEAFGGTLLQIYHILDEKGAIVSFDADELIVEKEYFSKLDKDKYSDEAYKESYVGKSDDTFKYEDKDLAINSGATMTSIAVRTSTKDVFETFKSINSVNGGSDNEKE